MDGAHAAHRRTRRSAGNEYLANTVSSGRDRKSIQALDLLVTLSSSIRLIALRPFDHVVYFVRYPEVSTTAPDGRVSFDPAVFFRFG